MKETKCCPDRNRCTIVIFPINSLDLWRRAILRCGCIFAVSLCPASEERHSNDTFRGMKSPALRCGRTEPKMMLYMYFQTQSIQQRRDHGPEHIATMPSITTAAADRRRHSLSLGEASQVVWPCGRWGQITA